jgi:hypothetical protein
MSKKSNEVEDFAIALARELCSAYPPGEDGKNPASMRRMAQAIDVVCNHAAEFQKQRRLGMFGRARVGTAFKLQLKEAGYPETFVDDVTRQLLLIMSGK